MGPLLRIALRKSPIKTSAITPVFGNSKYHFRSKKTANSGSLTRLYELSSTGQEHRAVGQLGTVQTNVQSGDIETADFKRSREAEGIQVRSETEWEYRKR